MRFPGSRLVEQTEQKFRRFESDSQKKTSNCNSRALLVIKTPTKNADAFLDDTSFLLMKTNLRFLRSISRFKDDSSYPGGLCSSCLFTSSSTEVKCGSGSFLRITLFEGGFDSTLVLDFLTTVVFVLFSLPLVAIEFLLPPFPASEAVLFGALYFEASSFFTLGAFEGELPIVA